jgi:aminomethyltransferase
LKFDKNFIVKDVLAKQNEEGTEFRLKGIENYWKGYSTHGYEIVDGDNVIVWVSSGLFSPTLGKYSHWPI